MANDDNNDEQDDFFGDDEDFGLPELNYEALDGDDDSDGDEDSFDGSADDSVFESDSASHQMADDEWDTSLNEEATADPTYENTESNEFYEEESFDDFEASNFDGGEDISDSIFSGDEVEGNEFSTYEDDLVETEEDNYESTDSSQSNDETPVKKKGGFAKVVIVGILIFAALGGAFMYLTPLLNGESGDTSVSEKTEEGDSSEKPASEDTEEGDSSGTPASEDTEVGDASGTPASEDTEAGDASGKTASEKTGTTTPVTKTPTEPKSTTTRSNKKASNSGGEANSQPAKNQSNSASGSAQNKPAQPASGSPGTINTLSSRTGNFYIIVGSFIDSDLARDYTKKLSNNGKNPFIILPYGRAITHRVAISKYGTLAGAVNEIEAYRSEYGSDVWVLKY